MGSRSKARTGSLLLVVLLWGVLVIPALTYCGWLLVYLILHPQTWQTRTRTAWGALTSGLRDGSALKSPQALRLFTATLLFGVVTTPSTVWRRPEALELIFVERGVVSFTKPDDQRFGEAANGMYGMLPNYARLFGCKSSIVKMLPEDLRTHQVVVFTNLDQPLEPADQRRLREFVAEGGRLWVLGDHTSIKNGRNHINDVLAPCHVRLRHDSVQLFPQGWFHSYQFLQGTSFGGLRDVAENRPAMLAGASLELEVPAQPLILGRFG